jgi:penicillin amidase
LGSADWNGWRAAGDLPGAANPGEGFLVSANGSRSRVERLRAALSSPDPRRASVEDSVRLQHDVLAWNAGRLVPLLAPLRAARIDVERARQRLLAWNRQVSAESGDATIYVTWERTLARSLVEQRVPAVLVDEFVSRGGSVLVPALTSPSAVWFDGSPARARDELLVRALTAAVDALNAASGAVRAWGEAQPITFAHPLAINDTTAKRFNRGPIPRGGYEETVMFTGAKAGTASVGASFSAVFDSGDWDRSVALNAPGQSESPDSRHFADLIEAWRAGRPFPLLFSEAAVGENASATLTLTPRTSASGAAEGR